MGQQSTKSKPTWADVKISLASFDRAALLGVLQDLYATEEGNRCFLHAPFGLGEDPLQPYKKTLNRWLWPDVFRGQQASVSRAKWVIAKYQKALGDPVGLAELVFFYCERAAGFCENVDNQDAVYLDSMVRVFEHALKAAANLTGSVQTDLLGRLDRVRSIGR